MFKRNRHRNAHCHAGFSMIEVVLSTLLIGIVLVTALNAVRGSIQTWQATDNDLVRHALAHELMTEVLATSYSDPEDPNGGVFGIDSGESSANRLDFDDVDDFDDWHEHDEVLERDGTVRSGFTNWDRKVRVEHLQWDNPTTTVADSNDQGLKRIEIEVEDSSGKKTFLWAIHSRGGTVEQAFGLDTQVISGTTVQITVGTDAPTTRMTNLINHAQAP